MDDYPCHILLRYCLPLQLWVVGINWEGKGGQGFDPCFSLSPPCNACVLVAEVSQLDTVFSDVGKKPWSDKDLRFGCEQTNTLDSSSALFFDE